MTTKKNQDYSAKDIKQLPFPENVRKRPQVYLGDLDDLGSLTCLREIVNNSVDEHLRGFCDKINVVRLSDREFIVTDNGRGVPFDIHDSGKNVLEVIFGELHAGRNFDDDTKREYTTGLNGVGASAVNAVSDYFSVTSRRGTTEAKIAFERGLIVPEAVGKKKKTSVSIRENVPKGKGYASGTIVRFTLDETLFSGYATDEDIVRLLRETAYLNTGLELTYKAPNVTEVQKFSYSNGLEQYLVDTVPKDSMVIKPVTFEAVERDVRFEVSFTYVREFGPERFQSFCNTINTAEHGVHVTGFKRALSQYMLEYVRSNKLSKDPIENEDIYNGLVAMVSVFVFNPKYTTQTKTKLKNDEVNGIAFSVSASGIKDWLDRNAKVMKALAERFALTARARLASKRAVENVKKENSTLLSSLGSISKFTDCVDDDDKTELFIVEGESASGTVLDGRNPHKQAVFELKGKIINPLGKRIEKLFENDELNDLISVLRCGVGEVCDPSKTKFGKIIILSDADDDGLHIQLLSCTNFVELMYPLVEQGRIYIARPPLYRVTAAGKKPVYFRNNEELDNFFLGEVEKNFDFAVDGETVSDEDRSGVFHAMMEYYRALEKFAETYRLDPHVVEIALLKNFDGEDIKLGKHVTLEIDDNGLISIVGFYRDRDSGEEHFISVVGEDGESFLSALTAIHEDHYSVLAGTVDIVGRNGKLIEGTTLFSQIAIFQRQMEKSYKVLRFKGLGEATADELWETTLDPKNRELVQVTADDVEEAKTVVNVFMHPKEVDFRKEFLLESFGSVSAEDMTY